MFFVEKTYINDLLILSPKKIIDSRGFFSLAWNKKDFDNLNIRTIFVQDHRSFSNEKYTLRGLHYQKPPHNQCKLVSCISGSILDVVIDVRNGSKTYGQSYSKILSSENSKLMYIPEGFLHGFITLQKNTEVMYKCSNYYNKDSEITILYNDKNLDIDWTVSKNQMIISEKDLSGADFKSFNSEYNIKD